MKKIAIVSIAVLLLFAVFSLTACDAVNDLAENLEQSIDGAGNGGEQGGNGNGGEPGGNGNGGGSMTQEAFFAELERRETATFADNDLRYAALDVKLVLAEGDASIDGTYEATRPLTYGIDQYDRHHAYVDVRIGQGEESSPRWQQQQVLGLSASLTSTLGNMPEEIGSQVSFAATAEGLEFLLDTEYMGMKIYMQYLFDEHGFLLYRVERSGDVETGNGIEFTAVEYQRTQTLTKEEYLSRLEEAERLSYQEDRYHYSALTYTLVKDGAGDIDGTYEGTAALSYDLDLSGKGHASFEVRANEVSTLSLQVLGFTKKVTSVFNIAPESEFEIERVGSDIVMYVNTTKAGTHFEVRYVFDNEGYVRYYLQKQGDLKEELTVSAYAKVSADEEG